MYSEPLIHALSPCKGHIESNFNSILSLVCSVCCVTVTSLQCHFFLTSQILESFDNLWRVDCLLSRPFQISRDDILTRKIKIARRIGNVSCCVSGYRVHDIFIIIFYLSSFLERAYQTKWKM